MVEVVLPDEFDHLREAVRRVVKIQIELALGLVELRVDRFQHFDEQLLLAAEVVIDHPVVRLRGLRNTLDAPARITLFREDPDSGAQDLRARVLRLLRADAGGAWFAGSSRTHRQPRYGVWMWHRMVHARVSRDASLAGRCQSNTGDSTPSTLCSFVLVVVYCM